MIGVSLLYITKSGQSRYSRQPFCSCAALCSIPLRSISHAGIRPFSALRSALTRFRFAPSRTRASAPSPPYAVRSLDSASLHLARGHPPLPALRSALARFRFAPSRTRASALCVKGEILRNSCKHDSGGSLLLRALLIAYAIISRSSTSGRSL